MNLANKLTLSRVAVIPFFLVTMLPQSFGLDDVLNPYFRTIALFLFIAASITDYYDGMLARKHGWITNFGKLVDPLADKVMVMTAFVCLVEVGVFPAWMVVLILTREFLITGLRTLAIEQGRVLAADRWGKNKTISQITVIVTGLTYQAAKDIMTATGHWEPVVDRTGVAWWLTAILWVMMFLTVALTVFSGLLYIRKNWDLVSEGL
jgi:CDP-diacylglycerol--glycerol-3-phosphate 3-phosphatidyltransferase